MRRLVRSLGTLLVLGGILCLVWAVLVWQWQDPFTSVYTKLEQRDLSKQYDRLADEFARDRAQLAVDRKQVAADARRFADLVGRGDAIGRIRIPSIGVDMVLVNGTDHESLKRGPGRYTGNLADLDSFVGKPPRAYFPGQGQLVYVAGHRTTYAAPFSRIDRMRKDDVVVVEMPYATFRYRVTGHRIVPSSSVGILVSNGAEILALQACHPRFRASHRYVVYAKPIEVLAPGAKSSGTVAAQSSDR